MLKRIAITLFALCLCAGAADVDVFVPDAGSEKTEDRKATKEDAGILSSLIMTYQTVRNGVKYAYDEIIYLRNIGQTVNSMRDWIQDVGRRGETLGSSVRTLFVGEGNFFIKLQQIEDVFNNFEDVTVNQLAEFDKHVSRLEFQVDALATNPYVDGKGQAHGIVVAPTERMGQLLQWASENVPYESIGKLSKEERLKALQEQNILGDPNKAHEIQEKNLEAWEEIDKEDQRRGVVDISKMIANHVMSNSRALEQWAVNASAATAGNEEKFNASKSNGVIGNDMQAAWWMIEQANSKNREIMHQELLCKAYMGILGVEIFEASLLQSQRKMQAADAALLGMK